MSEALRGSNLFKCLLCGKPTKCTDSRALNVLGLRYVRRRRECISCGERFTTKEERVVERADDLAPGALATGAWI